MLSSFLKPNINQQSENQTETFMRKVQKTKSEIKILKTQLFIEVSQALSRFFSARSLNGLSHTGVYGMLGNLWRSGERNIGKKIQIKSSFEK